MEHGRNRPQPDHFLGTADIIARVKLAQGRPVQRLLGALRWPVVVAMSALTALMLLAVSWRSMTRQGPAPAALVGAPSKSREAPHETPLPPSTGSLSHVGAHGLRAPVAHLVPVKISLLHQAGAIWLDGVKVADKKRAWSGQAAAGNHELSVRCQGQMMRHTFVVQKDAVTVTVDPIQHTFNVASSSHARRGARQH